ncbi:acetoacetate--CoA ligase [Sphingopyxis kveilinensis]|uniref:acetoacetate--CoA ligase n=1 Tax=Sphingopyxis kveilinensis TaxID=3114367 RepID=UPI0030D03385
MTKEGEFLWRGSDAFIDESNVVAFMRWLEREEGLAFGDYEALRAWSVAEPERFWSAVWSYFDILSDTPYVRAISGSEMPGTRWFEGSLVNYAEHVLRHEAVDPDAVVLHAASEVRANETVSWRELGAKVRALATKLRERGIGRGDRVVSYMPNIPETVIAMLATTAIGAIWSSAAPEFGVGTVLDRFTQIEPKLLFAADGYRFAGKKFDRRAQVDEIVRGVPSIKTVVWLDYMAYGPLPDLAPAEVVAWGAMTNTSVADAAFRFERVPHDHPLWILFSSGTTGLPKPIVHSHVGIVVEHYKMAAFHLNLKPGSVMFFYSTTGWMMWNSLMLSLLMGGAAVLYDGSPVHPGADLLWKLAADTRTTLFGASPAFIELMRKDGIAPRGAFDLDALEAVLLSGAPSTPETFRWFYDHVKDDLWVTSQSGGTEFCSGVVVAAPNVPVYAGEIQARALGVDVRVYDDEGREIVDQVGEMVIVQPMPSMPLFLWGDRGHARYRESYFDLYPGKWRHGDFMKVNGRGGCYVYGRSDSTLNRFGVRIGSSEIYRTMEGIDAVLDSLVVCIERPDGGYYMPLFVRLRDERADHAAVAATIGSRLRTERSPRHVPDEILFVPAIPYTMSGKKMEVPVRKLLMGWAPERSFSRDAMQDPSAIDWYLDFAADYAERDASHLRADA